MLPYEPSFAKDLYAERIVQAEAERLAREFDHKRDVPTERIRERRGVSPLLAWAEGLATIRRFA